MSRSDAAIAERHVIVTPPDAGTARMDRLLVRGLAWTGSVKWASQLLSWIGTIVVARLLDLDDYGVVAMAGVFLGLIALLNEFGLGTAIVALRYLTDEQIAKIHGLAGCFGVAGFVVASLLAVPAGYFFKSADIPWIMVVAGTGFILVAMRSVPVALFEKELQFKFLALLEGGQAILATVTTVGIAWWGGGYWALVLGSLVGNAGGTITILIARPIRYSWPTGESIREAIRFSSHVLVHRLSWHAASTSDVLIGGRMLGQALIGAYSFAFNIASMPMEKVTGLMSRVMPAFYSSVQKDPTALRRYLLLVTEGVSLITVPVGVGMALVADDFVILVFGAKWETAVAPLQVLAAWAAVRSLVGVVSPLMYVTGGSRASMINGLLCAATYPLGFFVGCHWGLVGLGWSWIAIQPFSFIIPYRHVLRAVQLSFWGYLRVLQPVLTGVVIMTIGILTIQHLYQGNSPSWQRFSSEVLLGAIVYGSSIFVLHRDRIRQLVTTIKNLNG